MVEQVLAVGLFGGLRLSGRKGKDSAMARQYFKRWWVVALASLVLLVGGLVVILSPGEAVSTLGSVIGVVFVAYGILLVACALATIRIGYDWGVLAFASLWALALGVPLLIDPRDSASALASVIGAVLLVGSALQVISAAALRDGVFGRGRELLRGVLGLALGAVLVAYPSVALEALAALVGAWMLGSGALLLLSALALAGYGRVRIGVPRESI